MNRSEVYIRDFRSAVQEKDRISDARTFDKWEMKHYETADGPGTMLYAIGDAWPEPVTVAPQLTGWYRIYVCMTDVQGAHAHLDLKLSDDEFTCTMRPFNVTSCCIWQETEAAEEFFWKIADMTDQTLTISKLRDGVKRDSNLLWVHFVPTTEEEGLAWTNRWTDPANRTIHAHMDGDFYYKDAPMLPRDYCKPFYSMKDSAVKVVSMEVCNDLIDYSNFEDCPCSRDWDHIRMTNFRRLSDNRDSIYPTQIEYAHQCGIQLFAAHRMGLSNFGFPYDIPIFTIPFVENNPQLRCMDRNGRYCDWLSYAYTQVQDFMIGNLLECAQHGFDGVTLIFHRGQCVLFEEPVCKRFAEKYGTDIDYRRLPASDPRLSEIRSDVMTEFLTRARAALNAYAEENSCTPLKIYITAYYTVSDSLYDGLDVARFAAEGIIDGVVQSNCRLFEEIDDVLAEDGLIDLEKYKGKTEISYTVKRDLSNHIDITAAGLPAYRAIADQYGIDLFSEVQWENSVAPEEYVKAAKELYSQGTHGISLWDCYPHRVNNRPEWEATSQLNPENAASMSTESGAYHKVYKVLSYIGRNMHVYNPCWRG